MVAHEGFLVGGEAGFDVQKAQLTKYAAAFGYHAPTYSMAVTATSNLKLFSASYYHRVNEAVELLAKGRARRLLITGVNQQTSRHEMARLMPNSETIFRAIVEARWRSLVQPSETSP